MKMKLFYASASAIFAAIGLIAVTPTRAIGVPRKLGDEGTTVGIRGKNLGDVAGDSSGPVSGGGSAAAMNTRSRRGRPQRRRLHASGKRSVYLHIPKGNGTSTTEFHDIVAQNNITIIEDEMLEDDLENEMGLNVLLTEEQIEDMAEDYQEDRENGTMKLVSNDTDVVDLEVHFLDNQESSQERFIKMASDPSFICLEGATECAGKSMEDFYGSYQQPDSIFRRLDDLTAQHQGFVQKSSIGNTYQGRNQVVYKLTNFEEEGYEDNDVVVYICGTHPREGIATMTCPYIMETLLLKEKDQSASDFNLTNGLLNEIKFIIIPIFNLDGFHYNHKFDKDILLLKRAMDEGSLGTDQNLEIWQRYSISKMWRMTMKPNEERCRTASLWADVGVNPDYYNHGLSLDKEFNETQCIQELFGVDLNRNFPSHWMGGGASNSISYPTYAGVHPADQIETQNLMKFAEDIAVKGRLLSTIDVHCCAAMWLVPTGWHPCKNFNKYGRCSEAYGNAFDLPLTMDWSQTIAEAIAEVNGNEFKYGPISTVIYTAAGTSLDWTYEKLGVLFSGAPEIYRDPRSATDTTYLTVFYPHNGMIRPGINEVYAGMVAGVQYALDNADKRVSDIESFPLPEPGYPIEYMCDNVVIEGLCNLDCTSIEIFPFDLRSNELSVTENTGVDPCGAYLQSFENGTATYVSAVPGTLFSQVCPNECSPLKSKLKLTNPSWSMDEPV